MKYKKLLLRELPVNSKGTCYIDLYVHLALNSRYVRYVAAGETFDHQRLLALKKLEDASVYVNSAEFLKWAPRTASRHTHLKETLSDSRQSLDAATDKSKLIIIKGEKQDLGTSPRLALRSPNSSGDPMQERFTGDEEAYLKEEIHHELLGLYKDLRNKKSNEDELDRIESITTTLLATIAPEVESLRNLLAQNAKYIYVMSDSAAIASIAILFAIAKNFSSRNVFKDLAYATILMDMALADLNESEIRQYYIDKEKLSPHAKKIAFEHPANSYKMLKGRLRTLSDICGQLIANHHELYSGRGFPRRVRSDILTPLARVLALAVDVFEAMKKSQILGAPVQLRNVVYALRDETCEAHLRRHSRGLMDDVANFLDSPGIREIFGH